ncbi:polysaccharide deacetylase family protein [Dyadobacter luticola]|uniref:ChbG/HpnK family deacetylase n=1 Tax=Dyadobacter luticola TaxID=1979387 RepID=A0A5R9KW61_9BACT|nr:polysaccharide deacetylase family protein [Dyadobacter luticola]TLV00516.1 ChbG/HpnK family deacetylase [Dyadobacter luticola]
MKRLMLLLAINILFLAMNQTQAQTAETYAEKLGWPKGAKVVIFHVDDAGMSYSSNEGVKKSIQNGIATSCSIMMPCPWAASFAKFAIANPNMDAGLHLTLTSEWQDYRWPPLTGIPHAPGLTDNEGAMWHEVEQVIKNASPDEVEAEIRAQLDRALKLGLKPTHMDSHMGTLFAHIPYLERYIKVGAEHQIPVMFPGGNNKLLIESLNNPVIKKLKSEGKWKEGMKLPNPEITKQTGPVGQKIWAAGLPVLDDLHTISGDWKPEGNNITPEQWGKYKAQKIKETLTNMQPGVAMIIVHSSDITEEFKYISASGGSRHADMLSMMDKDLKEFIKSQGIIQTTWKEMMERRKKVK